MPGIEYLLDALTLVNIMLALGGVIAGTIIGSLPGLTATMAVAVLVPITFSMPAASALILMGAIYTGAIYGHPGTVERRRLSESDTKRIAETLHQLAEDAADGGLVPGTRPSVV